MPRRTNTRLRTPTVRDPLADPTPAQASFLRNLYDDTKYVPGVTPTFDAWVEQLRRQSLWTRGAVSTLIDQLQQRRRVQRVTTTPPVHDPATPPHLLNRVGPPGDSTLVEPWVHGVHFVTNPDTVYRVGHMPARRGRGVDTTNTYVWRLNTTQLTGTGRARWQRTNMRQTRRRDGSVYTRGPNVRSFTVDTLLTAENARTFGQAVGFCAICGRTLTVPESIERSVGPVCWRRIQAQAAWQAEQREAARLLVESRRLANAIDRATTDGFTDAQREDARDALARLVQSLVGGALEGVAGEVTVDDLTLARAPAETVRELGELVRLSDVRVWRDPAASATTIAFRERSEG